MKKIIFRMIGILAMLIVLAFIAMWWADSRITSKTKDRTFNSAEAIPYNKTGLLLGTAKLLKNGKMNPFFQYRIDATTELFKAGKIKYIVVSGDNSVKYYNEPQDMKDALVKAGVPAEVIFLDYAGFRTLDSIVRMEKIFSQKQFTIISQQFHNERAIYLARHYGLDTIGYNARDVSTKRSKMVLLREKLARVKVFVDFIINKQPKFLGKKVHIP